MKKCSLVWASTLAPIDQVTCQGDGVEQPLPSKSALVRIGKAIACGTETDDQLDLLDLLLARCDDVQARATEQLNVALEGFEHRARGRLVARGRAKTLLTLREKLARMGGHKLPVIRDLAGLRIVGDLTLDEQDRLLPFACAALGVAEEDYKVIDRRTEPMQGYRALHAEFVLEGVRVELQIRTFLQHQWAEVYERLADRFGRSLRYEAPDPALEQSSDQRERVAGVSVAVMQEASRMIATEERMRRQEVLKVERLTADHQAEARSISGATLDQVEDVRQRLVTLLSQLGQVLDKLEPKGDGR